MVDGSGSICVNSLDRVRNTCDNWELIKRFLRDAVDEFNIGPSDVRLALVVFADTGEIVWDLNE